MTSSRRRPALITLIFGLVLLWPVSAVGAANRPTLEGTLRVVHGENFATGQEYWDYHLQTAHGTFRLEFGGPNVEGPAGFRNGARVRVHGTPDAHGVVEVGSADGQVVEPATVAATTTKNIAVLLVNFLTDTSQPWTVEQANNTVFAAANSVANYFADESYGQMAVTGDVYGYYTIDYNTATCNYSDIASKAKSAAIAAGVNLSAYTNIQYSFVRVAACGWSGLAYLPGTETWLNQALSLYVSGHELSHNFGVHHASTISCTENSVRVALSASAANCTVSEYGDPFSIMGNGGSRHTHNQQLATLGWISSAERVTISVGGTYTLGASEDPSSVPKAMRIARGNGTYLYLEVREPWGAYFDSFGVADPVVTGISLRISNDWTTIIQSKLIDTTPATSSYSDSALAVGMSFTDPVSGATVTTVSLVGGVATVDITWGPDTIPPSTPTNLTVSGTGVSTATVSWSPSTDNRAVAGYEVTRDGAWIGTTAGTSYGDSGLVGGQAYVYTVTAFDAAGNHSGAATKSWTQPIPDTTAPSAPTNLHSTAVTKSKISLAWNASVDNVGVVGYRIYRNGVLWATVSGTSYTGTRSNKVYTYTVKAYDAAGNVSGASNSLTK